MVCGYDTYHDSSQRDRSVGAFVSSLNDTASRWYSQAVFQGRGSELQDNLSPLLRSKCSFSPSYCLSVSRRAEHCI